MFPVNELYPRALLDDPVVFASNDWEPTAVLLSAVFNFNALYPTATLLSAQSAVPVSYPIAVLLTPSVQPSNALWPKAVFLLPVVRLYAA